MFLRLAEQISDKITLSNNGTTHDFESSYVFNLFNILRQKAEMNYHHVWPDIITLIAVWVVILVLHISKNYSSTCSVAYWILNLLQVPVAVGASVYQAVCLYNGSRVIMSSRDAVIIWKVQQLILCCCCGILAGIVGGLLGLGGGFIFGPLLLELGIPPQVSSATTTFVMTFSSSMSVIQYYLLRRFPVPYALYFVAVTTIAAFVGQNVVRKIISIVGRASVIIFVLAFCLHNLCERPLMRWCWHIRHD